MVDEDFKNRIDGLIEKKRKTIKNELNRTQFITVNFSNYQCVIHSSLESACTINFTYLLVISFFEYSYFDYKNCFMKLNAIFNEDCEKVKIVEINKWKLSLSYDGVKGSSKENNFLMFKLIDRLGEKAENFKWRMVGEYAVNQDFNTLIEMTYEFFTHKEYKLSKEIQKLKEIIKNKEEEE